MHHCEVKSLGMDCNPSQASQALKAEFEGSQAPSQHRSGFYAQSRRLVRPCKHITNPVTSTDHDVKKVLLREAVAAALSRQQDVASSSSKLADFLVLVTGHTVVQHFAPPGDTGEAEPRIWLRVMRRAAPTGNGSGSA